MEYKIRKYNDSDIPQMTKIWNRVVRDGNAFPQTDELDENSAKEFFASQSYCAVADSTDGNILGLYILHPNNIGRCGHLANASYAVDADRRGLHIGEALVKDCLKQAKAVGFSVLQFNAVVASNIHARHLYERLGFVLLGTVPKGFRLDSGEYEDICLYYISL